MIRKAIGLRTAALILLISGLAVSASPPEMHNAIEHARLLDTLALGGELFHVQGVEVDANHIWITSADRDNHRGYIHEFDRTSGRIVRRLELTDGPRFHPGGISMRGTSIWVPVAELKANSSAVLVEIEKDTLQIRRRIRLADHLGCVAASGNTLIAGNWDSRLFYIVDLAGRQPVRTVRNPTRTRYQDMKLIDGKLVAGGMLTKQSGTIDWIDWPSMQVVRTLQTGATTDAGLSSPARALTAEGMTLKGRDLYLVPEDGPSRMFHFRLDDTLAVL